MSIYTSKNAVQGENGGGFVEGRLGLLEFGKQGTERRPGDEPGGEKDGQRVERLVAQEGCGAVGELFGADEAEFQPVDYQMDQHEAENGSVEAPAEGEPGNRKSKEKGRGGKVKCTVPGIGQGGASSFVLDHAVRLQDEVGEQVGEVQAEKRCQE